MITQEELKEWLQYDAETGLFTWLKVNSRRVYIGRVAGTIRKKTPYVTIVINRKFYYAHRLAWLYVYGEFPSGMLDHIDRNPGNNAISNLRKATYEQNGVNKSVKPKSSTGLKGVWKSGKKFAAYIGRGSNRIRLGLFEAPEEAYAAYVKASKEVHGEFSAVQPCE